MVQSKYSLFNEKVLDKLFDNRILADAAPSTSASASNASENVAGGVANATAKKKETAPREEEDGGDNNPLEEQTVVLGNRVSLEKFLKDCIQRVSIIIK
jgi:hypothetical protein